MKYMISIAVCLILLAGCGKEATAPKIPTRYEGRLNLVVYKDGLPAEHVPVVLAIANQVDPGPESLDTVFTNQYGVAFDSLRVICGTFKSQGELKVYIGDLEVRTIYYDDGETINILSWN